jgi:putative phosphoesterase
MTSLLLAILSDTHEDTRMIRKAVAIIKERCPDGVVHCGDIISPPVLELFSGLPMRFVYGNNDGERSGLAKKCRELGFQEIADSLTFSLGGRSFFVNHGTLRSVIDGAIASQKYDFVLHGHTHEQRNELHGITRVINPGALFSADRFSIAFLDIASGSVEFVEIPE